MNTIGLVLGIIVCIGVSIIPLPQLYHFVRYKDTNGVSLLAIFFSVINNNFMMFSILIHNFHFIVLKEPVSIIVFIQSCLLLFFSFLLFLTYTCIVYKSEYKTILVSFVSIVLFFAFSSYMSVYAVYKFPNTQESKYMGVAFGFASVVITYFQWVPQIVSSIKLSNTGVSKITFFFSIIGAILGALYLCFFGNQHWVVWLSYCCSALQQSVILFVVIVKSCKRRISNAPINVDETSGYFSQIL